MCHSDNLTADQAQLLILIEHSVHTFDPQGIHRTIKDDPLLSFNRVIHSLSEELAKNAVRPFMGCVVKASIQLTHCD